MARGGRRTYRNQISDPKELVEKILRTEKYGVDKLDVVGEFIKHKMPVHFGGMSDPFSNPSVSKVTKELLKVLNSVNYPIVFK